ncbi:MAG: MlaA family lipoprotein [Parasphingopyxis sp.]|uniref:MlaA family lipoprotein n=1 Tax=Parasphingopyxis sp. TaxID=1920299 RepID=UPI003FA10962
MRKLLTSLLLMLFLGACATTQAGPNGMADRDPHEEFNRDMWAVNQGIDTVAIRPVTEVYRTIAPQPARRGIANVFRNLTEPWSFINNLLQGKPGRALRNLGRFIINSTIGVGGLADHATDLGIEPAPEDFGQTLAAWGVGDGGYVMNPFLGPSTQRDTFGTIVDFVANPVSIFFDRGLNLTAQEQWGIRAGSIISTRSELIDAGIDDFLESSADPYAAARSAFFQRRENDILNYDTAGFAGDGDDLSEGEDAAFEAALEDIEDMEDSGEPAPVEPE